MSRTLKQLTFGSVYFVIFALVALGAYLSYFKSAPSCADNKQNQNEIGVDCGGRCIPCEVKGLNFSASFSYKFNLGGTLPDQRELRGSETLAPQEIQYIIVPNLPIDEEHINGVSLDVSELNWSENKPPILNVRVNSQSSVDKNRVTVTGSLFNNSAVNLPIVKLTALLFDKEGKVLNASITELEKVGAFSERQFIVFFPEVEGLAKNLDPQKTEIQWELDD